MTYLKICKQTKPEKYYSEHGFMAIEEAEKNLDYERTQCMMGHIDGRKQKTYDKLYSEWHSYFVKVLPSHIDESSYMTPEEVQSYLERHA